MYHMYALCTENFFIVLIQSIILDFGHTGVSVCLCSSESSLSSLSFLTLSMFSDNSCIGRSQFISAVSHMAKLQSKDASSLNSQSKISFDSFKTAKVKSLSWSSMSQAADKADLKIFFFPLTRLCFFGMGRSVGKLLFFFF